MTKHNHRLPWPTRTGKTIYSYVIGWHALAPSLFALVLLVACAPGGGHDSPSYREGFADGCEAARSAASALLQDAKEPMREDTDYRAGWRSGFVTCRTESSRYAR